MSSPPLVSPSIDPDEVAYFERLAHRWWDTEGPFWPLHRLNAFRVEYIRERLCRHFGRDVRGERPLAGLRLLDIGCGGGILSESLARLGADVVGSEVAAKNVRIASVHAEWSGLAIDYRLTTAADLAKAGETFDAVLNMEVVEHVDHLPEFLADCGRLVRPGGVMVVATINRTPLAWLTAIVGAEYILRWLPKGTHHYRKLVKPRELIAGLGAGFIERDRVGVRVNPLNRRFSHTQLLSVNYMMLFEKVPETADILAS
ncbi:bifunctional 2-polyprenyl-6-hydroxyphenol methylase/3-demethylubiquinol 3-O-methyltransferase UbiG [Thioalkalicoccus limnaeus]|uniref:Ubiquinone biosynthesis O-methyltransferase n=1 Tax=Thioalkalicoccus limnaeus TaxID=120681 RepID=A0ABV4BDF3_9GAMM